MTPTPNQTEKTVQELIIAGYIDRAKSLLQDDPSKATKKDEGGRLALHWATSVGSKELVEFLLSQSGVEIDARDDTNFTPLIIAAAAGRIEIVKLLLGKGADINAKNTGGHSALQYAASKNHVEIVELLITHHADPNIADEMNATPLHRAASLGNSQALALLLEKCERIQINARDSVGNTPLHLACEEDRLKEAELLVAHGADKEIENKQKKTPLDLASPATAKILGQTSEKPS